MKSLLENNNIKNHLHNIVDLCFTINDDNSSNNANLITMFSLVVNIKAKEVLELGVGYGSTSVPLLLGVVMTNGKLTSVDNNPKCFSDFICSDEFKPHYESVISDSVSFLQKCVDENKHFDLIFVDDFHGYEHVREELALINKLITPSDLVLLHDLMANNTWRMKMEPNYFYNPEWMGGPYKAVNELDKDKWEWVTIPVDCGLTVLRKKSDIIKT